MRTLQLTPVVKTSALRVIVCCVIDVRSGILPLKWLIGRTADHHGEAARRADCLGAFLSQATGDSCMRAARTSPGRGSECSAYSSEFSERPHFTVDAAPPNPHNPKFSAPVAQLDRVPGYELGGREFESLRAHHIAGKGAPAPFLVCGGGKLS